MNIENQILEETGLKQFQVANTLTLLKDGATIPFIARYRKEQTGSLDETKLREIEHKDQYYRELNERADTVLKSIEEQGRLTPALKKKVLECKSKTVLEDIYLPYKPKRKTRGRKAAEAGLEPLADYLTELSGPDADILKEAARYINEEKGIDTAQKAIDGACDILAERLSDEASIRERLRSEALKQGLIRSKPRKEFEEKRTKFSDYYEYSEPLKSAASHRVLALFRGEKEGVLKVYVESDSEKNIRYLKSILIRNNNSPAIGLLNNVCEDSYNRLLQPAVESSVRKIIREKAESDALKVFNDNLRNLLLAPPAGKKRAIGIDPGFRTGCKCAVIDENGNYREHRVIFPTTGGSRVNESREILKKLITEYDIELIAVGNGTAGRETLDFTREVLKEMDKSGEVICLMASESGASVYSASEAAVKEFPDLDVTVRGAISIVRRVQDPLSELVKIDPKSIGVGQYQHDVNQVRLKKSLEEVVESCVNMVGVDLNLASAELLRYVSGLNRTTAGKIAVSKEKSGPFRSRSELMRVEGIGKKAFEQAAGFLRIPDSENPLDNSAVHPERYGFVENICDRLVISVRDLIGNQKEIDKIDPKSLADDEIGLPTIRDILDELKKPGRDPREKFAYADFSDDIKEMSDLKKGMKLEGIVTNVTNFGAFVDIGVHQDGLVHISMLSDSYVKDPSDVVKVGQIVKVTVMDIDEKRKRISLSMKSDVNLSSGRENRSSKKQEKQEKKKAGNKVYKPKLSLKEILK